jgi:hypothetical protein
MSALDALTTLHEDLKALSKAVKAETTERIAKGSIRAEALRLGQSWFSTVQPASAGGPISAETLAGYSKDFERLVKISSPNNRKDSYIDTLDALTKRFKADLVMPMQTAPPSPTGPPSVFASLFSSLGTSDIDDAYLKEAVECARAGFIRASAVMGWCAAVARLRRTVEKEGFAKFNAASAKMTSQTQGRFKRFNKTQSVASLSDLQMVFDTDMLWILEGMGLLESNQHDRLRSCFELRNHSAHPGEAPVTNYNLLSFFSDIIEIVLKNPKFS